MWGRRGVGGVGSSNVSQPRKCHPGAIRDTPKMTPNGKEIGEAFSATLLQRPGSLIVYLKHSSLVSATMRT